MLDFWEMFGRLLLALAAGGVLGWEREAQDKPAGLRTHMMVSLGSALFILLSLELIHELDQPESSVRLDPLRVIQGIIGGIGFLGAGAIIQSGKSVHGLTTAASIWVSSSLGIGAGLGYYRITGVAVVLSLVVLQFADGFESWIFGSNNSKSPDGKSDEKEDSDS